MSLLQNMALYASIAGIVAIGATVAIERLGGRLGGILATLPTTIIPASIGIWGQSQDIAFFQAAMFAVPSGMLLNAGFLWLWRVVPPRLPPGTMSIRLLQMTCLALTVWGMGAVVFVQAQGTLHHLNTLGGVAIGITALMATLGWLATRTMAPSPKGNRRVGPWTLASRGLFAAAAIGCAIWLAAVSGPLAAGMASVFPAIFLTTMVAVWWAQGEAVQGGAVAPMMLGSTSVSAYAIAAAYWIPELGVGAGATLSWLVAVIGVSVPSAWWVGRSRSS
jgi:hypothetical protein